MNIKIRKITVFLLLLVFTSVSLSGCIIIPISRYYDDIDTESVTSVDFYDLNGVQNQSSYFFEEVEPVYTMQNEGIEDFWDDLADIRFKDAIVIVLAAVDPSFYYDRWVVRINYKDGTFMLISCDGYGEIYSKDGKVIDSNHFGCDNDEWHSFVEKYVPKEIFNS